MNSCQQVNKRKISFIVHNSQPQLIVATELFLWYVNRVCKWCWERLHDSGKNMEIFSLNTWVLRINLKIVVAVWNSWIRNVYFGLYFASEIILLAAVFITSSGFIPGFLLTNFLRFATQSTAPYCLVIIPAKNPAWKVIRQYRFV